MGVVENEKKGRIEEKRREYHHEELSEEANANNSENHRQRSSVKVGFGLGNFDNELVLLHLKVLLAFPHLL